MSEREVLEIALWTFGVTSFITVGVCLFFVWTMRGQRDRTSLGTLLRWNYGALAGLSAAKGFLFVYYGSAVGGASQWLDAPWRIVLLLAGSAFAIALDAVGFLLIAAWFRANRESLP